MHVSATVVAGGQWRNVTNGSGPQAYGAIACIVSDGSRSVQ